MRRSFLFTLFISSLLSGCAGRGDSLEPLITITDPRSGTVRTADGLTIRGYAYDDEGIRAIRVDGTDLLSYDAYAGERNKKLVQFEFRPREVAEGRWASTIVVEDVTGQTTTLPYPLQIDLTAPTLTLEPLTRLQDGQLQVSGTARDNYRLRSVIVNDTSFPTEAVDEKLFSYTVDANALTGGAVTVVAEDEAGNRTSESLTP